MNILPCSIVEKPYLVVTNHDFLQSHKKGHSCGAFNAAAAIQGTGE
jgi:hypothetical protein